MNNSSQSLAVLEKIYAYYETWASKLTLACGKGCATCCTRNVTITRSEGEFIVNGLQKDEQRLRWLTEKLLINAETGRPQVSTNEWAKGCLEGNQAAGELPNHALPPCPFLDAQKGCSFYSLRPFSCRCFGSTVDCARAGKAEQPDILMEVNTVTMQLIEHLERGRWWGNMLDILTALTLLPKVQEEQAREQLHKTIRHLQKAQPIPGFLVMPEQQTPVQQYLDGLFAVQTGQTTIGEILHIA